MAAQSGKGEGETPNGKEGEIANFKCVTNQKKVLTAVTRGG